MSKTPDSFQMIGLTQILNQIITILCQSNTVPLGLLNDRTDLTVIEIIVLRQSNTVPLGLLNDRTDLTITEITVLGQSNTVPVWLTE